jgi:single-strand DNA-binding protein
VTSLHPVNQPCQGINKTIRKTQLTMLLSHLIGHLGQDATTRTVADKPVICFSVGVKTGKDSTQWVNVTANEGLAKGVLPYLKKGTQVFVTGDTKTREYDKKDGSGKGFSFEVWASKIQLCGGKSENAAPANSAQSAPAKPAAPAAVDDSGDVPF